MTDRFDALASEYFDGDLSPQDAAELASLLRQDPKKKRAFLELYQQNRLLEVDLTSDTSQELARKILSEIEGGDTGQFVNTVMKGLDGPNALAPRKRPKVAPPVRRSSWKLRAGVAAAVFIGVLGYAFYPTSPESLPVAARLEKSAGDITASGGRRVRVGDEILIGEILDTVGPASSATLSFSDRTRIDLGGDASLRFQPDSRGLSGKSLLLIRGLLRADVTKQPANLPFLVRSRHAEIRVLGTRFEFRAESEVSRLEVAEGKVRFIREGGQGIDVGAGERAIASLTNLVRWVPLCDIDFTHLKVLPTEMEALFCSSRILHTPERKIEPGADRIRFENGLIFDPSPGATRDHGLVVARWKEEVGDDVILEADVASGPPWSLGFAVSGDSFEGYRIVYGIRENPGGIMIDTIAPIDFKPLVKDTRPIDPTKDHVLRVEKFGKRIRVWLDSELRLDAVIDHPLMPSRKRTFALSNYGESPVVRSLRVWKGDPGK